MMNDCDVVDFVRPKNVFSELKSGVLCLEEEVNELWEGISDELKRVPKYWLLKEKSFLTKLLTILNNNYQYPKKYNSDDISHYESSGLKGWAYHDVRRHRKDKYNHGSKKEIISDAIALMFKMENFIYAQEETDLLMGLTRNERHVLWLVRDAVKRKG